MKICKVTINNFRGIKTGSISFDGNAILVGDNNTGKSTVFEAIDLVLGVNHSINGPIIDEHDFFAGEYYKNGVSSELSIEVIIIDLNDEQKRHFANYIEWWDSNEKSIIQGPPAGRTDGSNVCEAFRLSFIGQYNPDEDDFVGQTFYSSTLREGNQPVPFSKKDKRLCGFLYLRTVRTGNRALSLEHGSLLDIILQLKEIRPKMWEDIISQLKGVSVAANPELGLDSIITSVQNSLSQFVSFEAADKPTIKVSNLTREHLRKVLTVFLDSGVVDSTGNAYFTPFSHQGTGTINTLVLTLLSMIADVKDNVIFAMEEPEIALPPHIQKRVVLSIIEKSDQALFTSHSPYVIEELPPEAILVVIRQGGVLKAVPANRPPTVKKKAYKNELKRRFCESLLSRRVLIVEGETEYCVYVAAARKLQNLHPEKSLSFELLGISVVNAETDTQIDPLGKYYKGLGKTVFAIFDKQNEQKKRKIEDVVDYVFEGKEKGIEKAVLNGIHESTLIDYGKTLVADGLWPPHLACCSPKDGMSAKEIYNSLFEFFKSKKGEGTLADLIEFCSEDDMPEFITKTVYKISEAVYPAKETTEPVLDSYGSQLF